MTFLRQHPRGPNGHLVTYVGLEQLAVEVRFPDTLHGEVPQIVYALREH